MSRIHQAGRYAANEVVDPVPMEQDRRAIFGILNGCVDRDNIPSGILSAAKYANLAVNATQYTVGVTARTVNVTSDWTAIPNDAGTADLGVDVTTNGEEVLDVKGRATWDPTMAGTTAPVAAQLGLFVDEELIGESGSNRAYTELNGLGQIEEQNGIVIGTRAVSQGVHRVRLRLRAEVAFTASAVARAIWVRRVRA